MSRLKIAILFGGRSVEHGVSIKSARNVFEYLDKDKFEPYPIGITQQGIWYLCETVDKNISSGELLSLSLNPASPAFITADGKQVIPDVVFPVLHGTDGEDGSIQGMLKAFDLPMVGTGVTGSAMSINKLIAKKMFRDAGLPTADFLFNFFGDKIYSFEEIKAKLGLPFMVKAANLGSSIGVSKVKTAEEYTKALDDSFRYDDCVIFEKYIKAREIECAVLGNYPPEASLPGEIIISPEYDFYTFDAKYVDDTAVKIEVPAKMDVEISARIRDLSVKAYQALQCLDFSRVDLFLTESGDVLINEINTIPGFTNSSMFPMMWNERGITFPDLITRLINLCLERYEKARRVERGFASNLKI